MSTAMTSSRRTRLRRAAALACTVVALPLGALTVAGPAAAAETSTWDKLAECESDGDWDISTGNGYYGGLQFSDGTWDAFGGERFAGLAHRASKAEQIRIAEKVLDEQGWGAWPACSSKLGLGESDAEGTPNIVEQGKEEKADAEDRRKNGGPDQRTSRQIAAQWWAGPAA